MNSNITDKKTEFNRLLSSIIESISSDDENACEYLREEGLDPDKILKEGIKRIKQMKLQINARKMSNEMEMGEELKQQAKVISERMLKDVNFSFPNFIKESGIVMQYRNLEKLSKNDIKEALENQLFLELLKSKRESKNGE